MLTLLIELQSSAKKFVTSLEKVVQQNQGRLFRFVTFCFVASDIIDKLCVDLVRFSWNVLNSIKRSFLKSHVFRKTPTLTESKRSSVEVHCDCEAWHWLLLFQICKKFCRGLLLRNRSVMRVWENNFNKRSFHSCCRISKIRCFEENSPKFFTFFVLLSLSSESVN